MTVPFPIWLGMGATIPAQIQLSSIDHIPFATVVPCLGASFLALLSSPPAQTRRPFALSSTALSFLLSLHTWKSSYVCSTSVAGAIELAGVYYGRICHLGKPTLLQEEMCYAPHRYPHRAKELPGDPKVAARPVVNSSLAAAVFRTDRCLTSMHRYLRSVVSVAHS